MGALRSDRPAHTPRRFHVGPLVAILLFALPLARADNLTWVFTPDAATVLGGDIELISGSFTFDSTTDTETGVAVTLTGPAPMAGTYTEPLMEGFLGDTISAYAPGLELDITFLNPLTALNSPDPIGMVVWKVVPQTRVSTEFISSGSAGSAEIVTPDPGSIALLATAIAMTGFVTPRRLKRL